jgi:7-cyano-7-deazaguanine reductase
MDLTHLGRSSAFPASPDEAVLDYVPNPRPGSLYLVRFAAPEFTSLCPVTGQPDFAISSSTMRRTRRSWNPSL